MTSPIQFLAEIVLAGGVSLAVILYLRGILRSMLLEICDRQPQRAEFWVRMLDVMMLIAPLILTQLFDEQGTAFTVLRRTFLMVLIGQFIALTVVARTIWGFVQTPRPPRLPVSNGFPPSGAAG